MRPSLRIRRIAKLLIHRPLVRVQGGEPEHRKAQPHGWAFCIYRKKSWTAVPATKAMAVIWAPISHLVS